MLCLETGQQRADRPPFGLTLAPSEIRLGDQPSRDQRPYFPRAGWTEFFPVALDIDIIRHGSRGRISNSRQRASPHCSEVKGIAVHGVGKELGVAHGCLPKLSVPLGAACWVASRRTWLAPI